MGKSHQLPYFPSSSTYTPPLQLIFSDIWGPATVISKFGFRYFISFIDAFSWYTCIFLLKQKSQAFAAFIQYKAFIELQTNAKIKALQTDNGGEYLYQVFTNYLPSHGIAHRLAYPYSH